MKKLVNYYLDLTCKKIDQSIDVYIGQIEAKRQGDWERVEFLEKVVLEPLDAQVNYLANWLSKIHGPR